MEITNYKGIAVRGRTPDETGPLDLGLVISDRDHGMVAVLVGNNLRAGMEPVVRVSGRDLIAAVEKLKASDA